LGAQNWVPPEYRQPVAPCGHVVKHLHSTEKLLGPGMGRVSCRFTTQKMCVALQVFWAAGQNEAMGMSTAVKEVNSSALWMLTFQLL